jgi:hypothetical protein
MVMSGDSADILGAVVVLGRCDGAWRNWRGGSSSERRRSCSIRGPSLVGITASGGAQQATAMSIIALGAA